jgi:mRNA interferase HigB
MWILKRKTLLDYALKHADAREALEVWYTITEKAGWESIEDVRKTYPHADFVDPYTVFNIKGNSYRLIVTIAYRAHRVYIKHFMTHAEYDKDEWKR